MRQGWGGWQGPEQSLDQEEVLWQWVTDSLPGLAGALYPEEGRAPTTEPELSPEAHSAFYDTDNVLLPQGRPGVFAGLSGVLAAWILGLQMSSWGSPPPSSFLAWMFHCLFFHCTRSVC